MSAPTLPSLSFAKTAPSRTDAVVIGVSGTAEAPVVIGAPAAVTKAVEKTQGRPLTEVLRAAGASATVGTTQIILAGKDLRLIAVGLGEDEPTPPQLRTAAASAVRAAGSLADKGLSITVSLAATEPEAAQAVAEGALLGAYRYAPISSKDTPHPVAAITQVTGGKREAEQAATYGTVVAKAIAQAREWVNLPPNLLHPATFAEAAKDHARDSRVAVEVLDEKALAKGGYGGILSVGGGSSRPPRLVRCSYAPRGAKTHIAIIGKGITFDSGGLNIKPGDSMSTMKCDMAGAAAVLAATRAIAELGLRVKVTAYAPMAENLPSDTAYRPSDVLTMYGGTTVENGNSDAEGRLVMADALARATEDKPDLILDVATLTGACMVALGSDIAGVMGNDEDLVDQVLAAAESAGEKMWPLPIPEDAVGELKSPVADLKSTGPRMGGALYAAAFLQEFVADVDWAHLDIAGPAFREGAPKGHHSTGGTGSAVATLIALAQSYAS